MLRPYRDVFVPTYCIISSSGDVRPRDGVPTEKAAGEGH